MKKPKQTTCIGIITFNRSQSTVNLVKRLATQLNPGDAIYIIENGSHQLAAQDFHGLVTSETSIKLFHLKKGSIPKSRNFFLKKAVPLFEYVAFLDDDCLPHSKWLTNLKANFLTAPKRSVLLGKVMSLPKNNIYAQVSETLYSLWLAQNSSAVYSQILDTKNCAFRSRSFRKGMKLFDEKYTYATDIELGIRLRQAGLHIYMAKNMLAYHIERQTYLSFVNHRVRLSLAYRKITNVYPNYFSSKSNLKKMFAVLTKKKLTGWEKAKVASAFFIIYLMITAKSYFMFRGSSS